MPQPQPIAVTAPASSNKGKQMKQQSPSMSSNSINGPSPSAFQGTKDPVKDGDLFRDKLRKEWNKGEKGRNMDLIAEYLEEAKLKIINLKYLEGKGHDIPKSDQALARDILEIGALYSIFKSESDVNLFERYLSQLKAYYFDYIGSIPVSAHKYEMLGANLLHLLADGRRADFHVELERILHPADKTDEILENIYIKRAVELEQALSEGRYAQVHAQDGPQKKSGLWRYFVEKLVKSTRFDVAETMEQAYDQLPTKSVMEMLKFQDVKELEAFASKKKWKHDADTVYFRKTATEEDLIPAKRLLEESLAYARELEIIV